MATLPADSSQAQPKPGAPPAAAGATTPPPTAPAVEAKPELTADPRIAEIERQTKALAQRNMKFSSEMRAAQAALAKERADVEGWRNEKAEFKRNPLKFLRNNLGEKYYDELTNMHLNGVPTPDLIASEMDEREQKMRSEFKSEAEKLREEISKRDAAEATRAQQEYEGSAIAYAKQNAEKYPLLNHFEEWGSIPGLIKQHFMATAKRGADGLLRPGEVLTAEQASKTLEERLEAIEKKFEERFQRKQATKQPVLQRNEAPQRRTLSNDMTATSSNGEWTPPKNDKERRERAFAAWDRVIAAKQH